MLIRPSSPMDTQEPPSSSETIPSKTKAKTHTRSTSKRKYVNGFYISNFEANKENQYVRATYSGTPGGLNGKISSVDNH